MKSMGRLQDVRNEASSVGPIKNYQIPAEAVKVVEPSVSTNAFKGVSESQLEASAYEGRVRKSPISLRADKATHVVSEAMLGGDDPPGKLVKDSLLNGDKNLTDDVKKSLAKYSPEVADLLESLLRDRGIGGTNRGHRDELVKDLLVANRDGLRDCPQALQKLHLAPSLDASSYVHAFGKKLLHLPRGDKVSVEAVNDLIARSLATGQLGSKERQELEQLRSSASGHLTDAARKTLDAVLKTGNGKSVPGLKTIPAEFNSESTLLDPSAIREILGGHGLAAYEKGFTAPDGATLDEQKRYRNGQMTLGEFSRIAARGLFGKDKVNQPAPYWKTE